MNKVYLDEMISGIKSWLVKHDYNYIECNEPVGGINLAHT